MFIVLKNNMFSKICFFTEYIYSICLRSTECGHVSVSKEKNYIRKF